MSQIRRIGARRLGRGTSTCRRGCCVATVSPPMAAPREACETDNEYPRKAVERREIVHLSSYFVKQVVPIEPSGTWLEGDDRACRVQFPKLIVFVAVVVNQARDQEETCRTQEEPKKSGDRGAVELKTSWDNDRGRLLSCIQPPGAHQESGPRDPAPLFRCPGGPPRGPAQSLSLGPGHPAQPRPRQDPGAHDPPGPKADRVARYLPRRRPARPGAAGNDDYDGHAGRGARPPADRGPAASRRLPVSCASGAFCARGPLRN